jgi:hypothetical protein
MNCLQYACLAFILSRTQACYRGKYLSTSGCPGFFVTGWEGSGLDFLTCSFGRLGGPFTAKNGTRRRGTIRNRSKPSKVVRAGFEPGRIAVTLRVIGCYCASARTGGSGGRAKRGRPNERRRKAGQHERPHREGHAGRAGRVKNFRASAMLKTTPPGCD